MVERLRDMVKDLTEQLIHADEWADECAAENGSYNLDRTEELVRSAQELLDEATK